MSCPSTTIWPPSALSKPSISLSVTLLPVPEPPIMVKVSPSRTSKVHPRRTRLDPKALYTFSNWIIPPPASGPLGPPRTQNSPSARRQVVGSSDATRHQDGGQEV